MISFFYNIEFLIQLIIAEGLFLWRLDRKQGFVWRIVGFFLIMLLGLVCIPSNAGTIALIIRYLVLFAGTVIALCFCFDEDFQNLLFCAIAGYTVAHLAYLVFSAINLLLFNDIEALGVPRIDPYSPIVVHTASNPLQTMLFLE